MCGYIVQLPEVCVFVDENSRIVRWEIQRTFYYKSLWRCHLRHVFKNLKEATFLGNEFQTKYEVCKDFKTVMTLYRQRHLWLSGDVHSWRGDSSPIYVRSGHCFTTTGVINVCNLDLANRTGSFRLLLCFITVNSSVVSIKIMVCPPILLGLRN